MLAVIYNQYIKVQCIHADKCFVKISCNPSEQSTVDTIITCICSERVHIASSNLANCKSTGFPLIRSLVSHSIHQYVAFDVEEEANIKK